MSSFFTAPASQRKRKRPVQTSTATTKRRNTSTTSGKRSQNEAPQRRRDGSESISGSDSDDDEGERIQSEGFRSDESETDFQDETAAEKRLRLAEQYLENVRQEVDEAGFDAAEIDKDLIAERLKEDVAESKGKVYRHIARDLDFEHAARTSFRADQLDMTAVACCAPYVYTAAKDKSIVKWELPNAGSSQNPVDPGSQSTTHRNTNHTPPRRPRKMAFARGRRSQNPAYLGHTSQILCAAASTTGRFLATGGLDRRLVVWDVSAPNRLKAVKVFTHHRDAVIGLAFRRGTNQLYSCSRDRTVKVWSLDELAYVETLFGHQDSVVGIASAGRDVCVSVGARDRTARLWKVGEETQLVFRGGGVPSKSKAHKRDDTQVNGTTNGAGQHDLTAGESQYAEGSIDTVALVDDESFVTGSDNGSIALWSIHKKKPVAVVPLAHGIDPPVPLEDSFPEKDLEALAATKRPAQSGPRWITALATIPYSDVILSGSWDGFVRAWKVGEDKRSLQAIATIGASGVVSGLWDRDGPDSLQDASSVPTKPLAGVINGIAAFEKGDRGREGVTVIAGFGKEHRLGRWRSFAKRSTAVLLNISRNQVNGHANSVEPESEGV